MKVEVSVGRLTTKLSFLSHAISSKSQLPILLNILIETRGGRLFFCTTDLEIGIEVEIEARILEEGGVTVSARTFIELIGSLRDTIVTLQANNNNLEVVSSRTRSVLQAISKEEFPKLYETLGDMMVKIDYEDLKKMFSRVVFSAITDSTRPGLSGVLVRREENGFLLVATDGFRLSLQHYKPDNRGEAETGYLIIPARVFRELLSIKEEKGVVEMYVASGHNQVIFKYGSTLLVGRLIDAQFPDFEKIIPTDFSLSVVFDREEMLSAVKTCSIFARGSANIVKFNLKRECITISSSSPSLGENTVDVASVLTGEENEIAFNAKYLMDLLNTLTCERLVFEMIGPLNPGVFKIEGDSSFLHLIMPIRTNQ